LDYTVLLGCAKDLISFLLEEFAEWNP
jgi:hypothetical protein